MSFDLLQVGLRCPTKALDVLRSLDRCCPQEFSKNGCVTFETVTQRSALLVDPRTDHEE